MLFLVREVQQCLGAKSAVADLLDQWQKIAAPKCAFTGKRA
jgi:hypothetical protein